MRGVFLQEGRAILASRCLRLETAIATWLILLVIPCEALHVLVLLFDPLVVAATTCCASVSTTANHGRASLSSITNKPPADD